MQEGPHSRISEVLVGKRQWVISFIISRFMGEKESVVWGENAEASSRE